VNKLEPGRIQAVDLGRQFRISTGGGRSLKATLLRRESHSSHEFWALRHVNLDVQPGETFGIVGRNGSGKSTLLKMLARIYGPSEGHCGVGGRMSSLIELGAGFHPEFNAIENVFLAGAVYGIPKRELERDLEEIIGFAELDAFAYQPIKTYSSGMFMRLGFSVAMHVRPDVLLLDEVLAVGDERFIQKCLSRIAQFRRNGGTMLLVTHDPSMVEMLCQRAILLEKGVVTAEGRAHDVMTAYHASLADERDGRDDDPVSRGMSNDLSVSLSITASDGTPQHQFVESDPIHLDFRVATTIATPPLTLSVLFRDELGRDVGGQAVNLAAFSTEGTCDLTFDMPSPPFRNGLFEIDLTVFETGTTNRVLDMPAIQSVSVYGREEHSGGPIRLGGEWGIQDS
jgi:ABC-type polysaccharide/polyol phosphate transport system ATPase subunit